MVITPIRIKGTKPRYQVAQSSFWSMGEMTKETMLINLMRMLRAGPEVSLKGSPTVSPTTVALWHSEPLGTVSFSSISTYFLALSQAPPALDIMTASIKPEAIEPDKRPARQRGPTSKPMVIGVKIAY